MAATSSSSAVMEEEEEELFMYGAGSGWVEARTSCDHLVSSLSPDLTHVPTPDTPCSRCEHPSENWLCLCCKQVFCSRFVNKHMLQHYQESSHCVALSYSDLSVWCFSCDAYLDVQALVQLRPVYEIAHLLKFGEAPPFRTIEGIQGSVVLFFSFWHEATVICSLMAATDESMFFLNGLKMYGNLTTF